MVKGVKEAECIVPSGEIGDVPELIKGLVEGAGFDMVFATIGKVEKEYKTLDESITKLNNMKIADNAT